MKLCLLLLNFLILGFVCAARSASTTNHSTIRTTKFPMRAIANKITTKSNASKASTNSFSAKTTIKPTRPKRATTRHKTTRRSTTTTTTPKSPVKCRYRTLRGMNMELNWFPTIDRGQEFIDYGQNVTGLCLQRATCENDAMWTVKVEECSDFNVVCENQLTFQGEFPACCIEC